MLKEIMFWTLSLLILISITITLAVVIVEKRQADRDYANYIKKRNSKFQDFTYHEEEEI